jgi:hypothetical protein
MIVCALAGCFVAKYFSALRAFFAGLFQSRGSLGVKRACDSGEDHRMMLVMRGEPGAYYYEIRQLYVPGGRVVRSCVLDSGKSQASHRIALRQGNAAMDRLLK